MMAIDERFDESISKWLEADGSGAHYRSEC